MKSEELRNFIFNVGDSENNATAFLVSSRYAVTVEHAIGKKEDIILNNGINQLDAKVIYKSSDEGLDRDIAILKFEEDVDIDIGISISSYDIKEDDDWITYGYPAYDNYIGDYLNGAKNKILQVFKLPEEHKHNVKLKYDDLHIEDFSGFSGAPLIVKGHIVGIINTERIQRNKSVRLTALSVNYFSDVLSKYNIDIEEDITTNVIECADKDNYIKYIHELNTTNKNILEGISFIKRTIQQVEEMVEIDIENILYNEKQYIILSEPGGGKTSAIKSLCYYVTEYRCDKIPIVLNLKDYNVNFQNIREGILNILSQYNYKLDIDGINNLINSGRLIIFFDGLDEVKQDSYHKCISELKDLLIYNQNSKYIITCRSNRYNKEFESMMIELELEELNEIDIRRYLFRNSDNIYRQSLDQRVIKIVKNPLLLNIFYNIIESKSGYIPKSRVDLYDEFVQTLIYKWNKKESKHQQINISMKMELLNIFTYIAYKTFKMNDFGLDFLCESVYNICKNESKSEELLDCILNLGILEFANDTVWFKHKTYKEYFVSRYIMKLMSDKYSFIEKIINDKDWNEVLIFIAGMFDDWEDQSIYLDIVLDNNFKLYIECVREKNDLSKSLINKSDEELSYIYLSTMITTYEKIINKYFHQIKHILNPYKYYSNYEGMNLVIKGNLVNQKHLYYKYLLSSKYKNVNICDAKLLKESELNSLGSEISFVNIELSNLDLDSARHIALRSIKKQLIDIIDKKELFSPQIICEKIELEKKRIGIRDNKAIIEKIDQALKECPEMRGYRYNGVDILNLYHYIKFVEYNDINIEDNILPKGDIDINRRSYMIWDVYSKERLVDRISKFFELYKKSIVYIVENSFFEIRNLLPCYKNLPYRYTVKYYFREAYLNGETDKYILDPGGLRYFYEPDKENNYIPKLIEYEEDNFREDDIEVLDKKYKNNDRMMEGITVTTTGISEILHNDSLSRFIHSKIKKEIEYLFDGIN